ncbi:MAG TPA: NADH-quinone oxidoreductase subunit NuoH [Bacteroidales bacterium]|nr:NADH-quinone oxidoreductase subunit NuoH [Bacteroidales bacterium]HBH82942.1 NADH-quinone oxidoreductase subunit NuoH [Bacteroidales bacterium]HBQ83378.1 NADH-quinone oxidoreductase subunit NuoH [Bacteroidales bacterium]HCU18513.1 NADH-quinone oxidoreductase subunit NuoH [Bacteroidales bacterium]
MLLNTITNTLVTLSDPWWKVFYDFSSLTKGIDEGLRSSLSPFWAVTVEMVIIGILFLLFYAVIGLFLVYAERKVCAFIQNRLGPNRIGPYGIFQTVADLIKLLFKELIPIKNADSFLFNLAPYIVIIVNFMVLAAIPFAKGLHAIDFNIGIFYVIAVSSMSVIGVLLAGWSSNSKYSLIGAMRSGAQIVSYELSIGLAIITVVILAGSLQLSEIVEAQRTGWFIFKGHVPAFIAFVIYIISGTAETNRGPFDMAEAESELTAGYHTEYSGIKFAFFYLAEYINMFIVASIASTLFLGGWMPFHVGNWEAFNRVMDIIPPFFWYIGKTFFVIYLIMLFKWTFPRLRIDQLLTLEWKYLLPINLVNVLIMAFLVLMGWHF